MTELARMTLTCTLARAYQGTQEHTVKVCFCTNWRNSLLFLGVNRVISDVFLADVDECESLPCAHGSTCVDDVNEYTCVCTPGYTGDGCNGKCNEIYTNRCIKAYPTLSPYPIPLSSIAFNDLLSLQMTGLSFKLFYFIDLNVTKNALKSLWHCNIN